jgi:thioredoxin-related protein
MFARKYATAARQYSDAVFLEIFGDESKATRQMMIDWKVKVTPTFVLFRDGQLVHNHGGINETKLHRVS